MIRYPEIKIYAAAYNRGILHPEVSEYIKLRSLIACRKYPFFPAFAGAISVR